MVWIYAAPGAVQAAHLDQCRTAPLPARTTPWHRSHAPHVLLRNFARRVQLLERKPTGFMGAARLVAGGGGMNLAIKGRRAGRQAAAAGRRCLVTARYRQLFIQCETHRNCAQRHRAQGRFLRLVASCNQVRRKRSKGPMPRDPPMDHRELTKKSAGQALRLQHSIERLSAPRLEGGPGWEKRFLCCGKLDTTTDHADETPGPIIHWPAHTCCTGRRALSSHMH